MAERGKYVLSQLKQLAGHSALLVDGYIARGTSGTITPQTQRGYTVFVHTNIPRVLGVRGIYVSTMQGHKPILSRRHVLRLPALFESLGHSNVILAAGGLAFQHNDGVKQGAISCKQIEQAWKLWKAGKFGPVSLSDGIIAYAKKHDALKNAFLNSQSVADQIYPGWKLQLTGG